MFYRVIRADYFLVNNKIISLMNCFRDIFLIQLTNSLNESFVISIKNTIILQAVQEGRQGGAPSSLSRLP